MVDGLDWLPEDGVVLTRADLERIFIDLRALISGTDRLDPVLRRGHRNRHHTRNTTRKWRPVMAKPKAIQWLEDQTGETIPYAPETAVSQDRHLSVRLTGELAAGLDAMATERGLTLSHFVRELIAEAVAQRATVATLDGRALADRLAADVAEVRRRLAG